MEINRKSDIPTARLITTGPPAAAEWTRLGFVPDARQLEVLESGAKWGILNCTRQWGKSTIGAAKAVRHAWSKPESLVLVASPSERQSMELMRKAATMLRRLGIRKRGDGGMDASLLLPNGSRIVGLPGVEATARGFSAVSLLVVDEAARVDDAAYKALRPMLSTVNGDLWLLSTPWGKRGFFYEEWAHGGEDWFRMSVPATECPRIAPAVLEREKKSLGPKWFAQEYLCGFMDNGAAMFGRDLVEAAFDPEAEELVLD
ncbi:MAG TPA: terminase family protein [Bryobacteraceae bacterium]|nr:terminase family protein [Bryobacteraceae bacterium]